MKFKEMPYRRFDCEKAKETLKALTEELKAAKSYEEYYLDNLHPNGLGTEVYGRNLVEEIRRLGF